MGKANSCRTRKKSRSPSCGSIARNTRRKPSSATAITVSKDCCRAAWTAGTSPICCFRESLAASAPRRRERPSAKRFSSTTKVGLARGSTIPATQNNTPKRRLCQKWQGGASSWANSLHPVMARFSGDPAGAVPDHAAPRNPPISSSFWPALWPLSLPLWPLFPSLLSSSGPRTKS